MQAAHNVIQILKGNKLVDGADEADYLKLTAQLYRATGKERPLFEPGGRSASLSLRTAPTSEGLDSVLLMPSAQMNIHREERSERCKPLSPQKSWSCRFDCSHERMRTVSPPSQHYLQSKLTRGLKQSGDPTASCGRKDQILQKERPNERRLEYRKAATLRSAAHRKCRASRQPSLRGTHPHDILQNGTTRMSAMVRLSESPECSYNLRTGSNEFNPAA
jgi:hypothetical protein